MPEGHSVHRLARQFQDVFGGARLAVSSPQGKFAAGAAKIDGHVLDTAQAHGKQMFLYFSHDLVMRVHLGLYGAWDFGGDSTFAGASSIGAPRRIGEQEVADDDRGGRGDYAGPPEPKGAVRVRLVSEHGWADLRGPTACEVVTPAEAIAARNKLGPDPLNNGPSDSAEFVRRIRKSSTSIAGQLMKQDVLAGVGNVYRAEVLFRLGLDPMLPGTSLQGEEAQALWDDTALIMADGVRDGRIITTELSDRPSGLGVDVGHAGSGATSVAATPSRPNQDVPVEDAHYVYKREGLPCRHCGTEIAMKELGGRKMYWCPACQGD
ncbi:Fpg/Nei family DNA glycosylase [Arthrobacter glacialis]|uniref:DNA-(apurinic or apyrimidinic site) lyase n=1 Tax=Arthrobacter glacialis TaxID=1664 RepID=A0A2S3ZWE8_ARTGL|nr:DNA-formamidopyrimidine glycosylase family protein [Arthrobacter glacialis]POH73606.1 formamidopyrimidine-DNA glycosylase [Arthrobacter glacialis]